MLVIKNYKKIRNQYFGDWQVGKMEELNECYAMQVWNINSRQSVTLIIMREPKMDDDFNEIIYDISLVEDGKGNGNIIQDIVYRATLEDMELFGESLVHYLNSL